MTLPAWTSSKKWYAFGLDYQNDGVVGVNAAKLWNNEPFDFVDTDIGLNPIAHLSTPLLYPGLDRSYEDASDLFPILANMLRGIAPTRSAAPLQRLAPEQVQADSDSVITVLLSEDGSLAAGQTFTHTVVVPPTPFLQVSMMADSALFRLRKPDGTVLSPADTLTAMGLHYFEDPSTGLAIYSVENPAPGTWVAVFDATRTTNGQEYTLTAEISTTKAVVLDPVTSIVYNNGSVRLRASLQNASLPLASTSWNVTVLRPDSTTFTVTLYDDGAHGDSLAGDGIFAASVPLGPQLGQYVMTAQAMSLPDSTTYVDVTSVELAAYQDLAVLSSEVTLSRNSVVVGDSVQIMAIVHNYGASPVNNAAVEVWDDVTGYRLDSLSVNLTAGGSANIAAPWVVTPPDTHSIRVTVSPFTLSSEVSYSNNSGIRPVIIGQPVNEVEPTHGPKRLQLAPPIPNPSTGTVTLQFSLPRDADASLVMYDVQGRRIKQWHRTKQVAGTHHVEWNGRGEDGRPVPTGLLFYRLSTGGQTLNQKLLHVR
ncbi:MAG: T9SS type A sorting domain-containing protein [Candidatus Kerfeldbacteria bacterium]|nr:T9SS type A sorting domain-containing protein [Candidatus Kerfeldbacteria bacterium]